MSLVVQKSYKLKLNKESLALVALKIFFMNECANHSNSPVFLETIKLRVTSHYLSN